MKVSVNELEQRLQYLENTASMLNRELPRLRQDLEQLKQPNVGQYTQVSPTTPTAPIPEVQPTIQRESQPQMYRPSQGYSIQSNPIPNQVNRQAKSKGMENFIGKNIMPIAASILTFIALIMFATVVLPNLTDTLKMIAMYLFSGALIVCSEVLLKKYKQNNWLLALLGCGVGAIFISLFVTTIYFHAINELVLYGLIVVWVAYTCYLGKHKNIVFSIIGQVGICIAMGFSIPYTKTPSELVFVSIILLLSELAFIISDAFKPNYYTLMATNIGLTLSGIIVFNAYGSGKDIFPTNLVECVVLFGLIAISILTNVQQGRASKDNSLYTTIYTIQTGLLFFGLAELFVLFDYSTTNQFSTFDVRNYSTLFCVPILCIGFGLLTYFGRTLTSIRYVMQGLMSLLLGSALFTSYKVTTHLNEPFYSSYATPLYSYFYFVLIVIALFYMARKKQKIEYSIYGLAIYTIFVLFVETDFLLTYSIVGIGTVVILGYLYLTKQTKSILVNNLSYVALLLSAIGFYLHLESPMRRLFMTIENYSSWDFRNVIMLGILFVLQLCALKTTLFKLTDNVDDISLVPRLCNIPIMLYGLFCLFDINNNHYILLLLAVGFVIGLFTLTVKLIIEKYTWGGAYIGFKYTLLCMVILEAIDSAKFVFSAVGLVLALICISLGFYLKIKSLRLYGLILSILCVLKLVMFDIVYSNTVGRASSFLFSGILCFIIGLIYNKLDAKMRVLGGTYEKENRNDTVSK